MSPSCCRSKVSHPSDPFVRHRFTHFESQYCCCGEYPEATDSTVLPKVPICEPSKLSQSPCRQRQFGTYWDRRKRLIDGRRRENRQHGGMMTISNLAGKDPSPKLTY
ncbi:hypothetical protein BDR07DRAFT_59462 [Suillus spraguei]|nr:hypothetical protein BDR07DRAFT_59462 [Suillus spraguei]